jgi:hypothetical protein
MNIEEIAKVLGTEPGQLSDLLMHVKAHAELADVVLGVAGVASARQDVLTTVRILDVVEAIAPKGMLPSLLIASEGTYINMLAEGTGRRPEEVVRGALAARHSDPKDVELFDALLASLEGGEPVDFAKFIEDVL